MIRTLTTGLALAALMGGSAFAETFEVQMLNKGSDGERMVFEPSFVQAARATQSSSSPRTGATTPRPPRG